MLPMMGGVSHERTRRSPQERCVRAEQTNISGWESNGQSKKHGRPSSLLLVFLACFATLLPGVWSACWKPAKFIEHKCKGAESNPQPVLQGVTVGATRRLLWHGGGAESKDIPDHALGEGQVATLAQLYLCSSEQKSVRSDKSRRKLSLLSACASGMKGTMLCVRYCLLVLMQEYRGDGGTLHDYELTGQQVNTPGSPDYQMMYAYEVESRFFDFCEGRADRGLADVFGQEDSWWDELLRCDDSDKSFRMCQKCGTHCRSWEWESSGYALLNGTELELEGLTWLTHNTYVTEDVILPLSVCSQFDQWICIRRLDENTKSDGTEDIPGMPKE